MTSDAVAADAPVCLALRHVPFESLGTLASPIVDGGYAIDIVDTPIEPVAHRRLAERDLLVVLGGPIGAYEDARYPFLRDELHLIECALAAGTRLLGVCLGAQLIARVLGARVYAGPRKEIGFAHLALTEAGRASALAPLDALPVLHWHGDTFDLPPVRPGWGRRSSTRTRPSASTIAFSLYNSTSKSRRATSKRGWSDMPSSSRRRASISRGCAPMPPPSAATFSERRGPSSPRG